LFFLKIFFPNAEKENKKLVATFIFGV